MIDPAAKEINSLSLLAHKVGPCVFDLSSYQTNVSIRDQIVRAQQLVTDLKAAHNGAVSLLIVGMGAAGMSAALAACEAGFTDVRAVDTRERPFSLFYGLTSRFVGPYMYEWPSQFHRNQSFPSHTATPWQAHCKSPLTWNATGPISAHGLAGSLENTVVQWCQTRQSIKATVPTFVVEVNAVVVKGFIQQFALTEAAIALDMTKGRPISTEREKINFWGHNAKCWNAPNNNKLNQTFSPDYVIVAAGMGEEKLNIDKLGNENLSPSFWKQDQLKAAYVANQRVVVVGGGDGAIQDSLRALTTHDHPLTLIAALERNTDIKRALERELPALLSADRQLRQNTSWSLTSAGFSMVDSACLSAAERLSKNSGVKAVVQKSLRKGNGHVFHLVRDPHFGKAYLLNRFVIYLLHKCVSSNQTSKRKSMAFSLRFNVEISSGKQRTPAAANSKWDIKLQVGNSSTTTENLDDIDHIVVRFGVLPSSIPGTQMIQLSPGKVRQRTSLKRVELPFVAM